MYYTIIETTDNSKLKYNNNNKRKEVHNVDRVSFTLFFAILACTRTVVHHLYDPYFGFFALAILIYKRTFEV